MGKLIYKMGGISADGYIAGPDGKFDWGAPDAELHQFHNDELRALGAHFLGRRLYETMLYWETAPQDNPIAREFACLWQALPKVVFSRTLEAVEGHNMRLARGDLASELQALRHTVEGDIGIGGPGLAGDALRQGLVDEVQVLIHPVAVGGGIPFFPRDCQLNLEVIESRLLSSRVLYTRYRVLRP